jgi:septum formation protein
MALVLASASPRRRELLALINPVFRVLPVDIDESPKAAETPDHYVLRLAEEKAMACDAAQATVLAADTTVAVDGDILVKPMDRNDARRMLLRLSGRRHSVFTAIAVRTGTRCDRVLVESQVEFDALPPQLIEQYLDTEEPWDKAGAYGIQGLAGCFVKQFTGSYSAVVGLPLCETRQLLTAHGIPVAWSAERDG